MLTRLTSVVPSCPPSSVDRAPRRLLRPKALGPWAVDADEVPAVELSGGGLTLFHSGDACVSADLDGRQRSITSEQGQRGGLIRLPLRDGRGNACSDWSSF